MGMCLPCLGGDTGDYDEPTPETRRRQMAEAAEKRQKDIESRGVKDPEALKRKQKKQMEMEKKADQTTDEGNLRWQVG